MPARGVRAGVEAGSVMVDRRRNAGGSTLGIAGEGFVSEAENRYRNLPDMEVGDALSFYTSANP
jgi:hypothetical protein